jgi:hypothetical protein
VTYFGSMRVDAPAVSATATQIVITGLGRYTWAAGAPNVRITIPRVPIGTSPAAATFRHVGGATYVCRYVSPYFRSVIFEQDRQESVPAVFGSYDTGSLPSGGPARTLSVHAAYAEAGVQLLTTGGADVVPTGEAGGGGLWSDAELHAAMVKHFTKWKDVPQWAVWLLHARLHDIGPNLLGIMFDQQGKQRQGCAVFYAGLAGTSADRLRLQLYTCVHELGHCFNLLHSWQKSLASPPQPNRPGSFSWMNYPWNFAGGPAAFWGGFPFAFDAQELIHIRHGFQRNVIMGGNPFAVGAALEDVESWSDPVEDRSGVALLLEAPSSFRFGAPVSVTLRLVSNDARGQRVTKHLRTRNGAVQIAIAKPGGNAVLYEPLLHHCMSDEDAIVLDSEQTSYADATFIHYGKDGFVFDQPGAYRIRARYVAPDGSIVLSNVLTVRVRPPATQEDEDVAELLLDDEVGTLMYLVGSDAEELRGGNERLTRVWDEHPSHPLAAVARLIQGVNAAREFKLVEADNSVRVRKPEADAAAELLGAVFDVDAARRAAARVEGEEPDLAMRATAGHLRTEVAPTLAPELDAFVRARRREIAAEVASVDLG